VYLLCVTSGLGGVGRSGGLTRAVIWVWWGRGGKSVMGGLGGVK
jgi:hypothetical protein